MPPGLDAGWYFVPYAGNRMAGLRGCELVHPMILNLNTIVSWVREMDLLR